MNNSLKKLLKELVDRGISELNGNKLNYRRIIICNSNYQLKDPDEILSRVETLFLNNQLRREIKVALIPSYRSYRDGKERDFLFDIGYLLKRESVREFLETYKALGSFSYFENWAERYKGEYKEDLSKLILYFQEKNSRGDSRLFGVNSFNIEDILEAIIQKPVF